MSCDQRRAGESQRWLLLLPWCFELQQQLLQLERQKQILTHLTLLTVCLRTNRRVLELERIHMLQSQRFCRTLALMNTQNSHTWAVIPQQSPNLCRIMTPQPPRGYPSRIPTTGRRLRFLPFDPRPKIPRPLRTLQPTVAFSPVRRSSVAS